VTDQFVGEIRVVGFTFPPNGWARCDGQLLPIQQNTALFQLLGTTYGGNGVNNFALPDIRERAVIHPGQGQGLSNYERGEAGGEEAITMLESELPSHTHGARAATDPAEQASPAANRSLARSAPGNAWDAPPMSPVSAAPEAVALTGGGQPHNNLPPYLVLNFIIALQGVFPPSPDRR